MAIHQVKSGPLLRISDEGTSRAARIHKQSTRHRTPKSSRRSFILESRAQRLAPDRRHAVPPKSTRSWSSLATRCGGKRRLLDGAGTAFGDALPGLPAPTRVPTNRRDSPRDAAADRARWKRGARSARFSVGVASTPKSSSRTDIGVDSNASRFGWPNSAPITSRPAGGKFEVRCTRRAGLVPHSATRAIAACLRLAAAGVARGHRGRGEGASAVQGLSPPLAVAAADAPQDAERLLAEGMADIVGARGLLADPDWPIKVRNANRIDRQCDYRTCKPRWHAQTVICSLWPQGFIQAPKDDLAAGRPWWAEAGASLTAIPSNRGLN